MYFSYGMGIAAVTPACVTLLMLDVSPGWIGFAALAQLLPISPLLLRYSRVLWLHLDQVFDPRSLSTACACVALRIVPDFI